MRGPVKMVTLLVEKEEVIKSLAYTTACEDGLVYDKLIVIMKLYYV